MTAQLDLFPAAQRPALPLPVDEVGGFVSMQVGRGTPYQAFDGATAQQVILQLCEAGGGGWVGSLDIFRTARMYPADLSRLASRMVDAGLLEEAHLYYGSSQVGPDYKGFQFGYRLVHPTQERAP